MLNNYKSSTVLKDVEELKPINPNSRSNSNNSASEKRKYEDLQSTDLSFSNQKLRYQRLGASRRTQIFPTAQLVSIYSGILR